MQCTSKKYCSVVCLYAVLQCYPRETVEYGDENNCLMVFMSYLDNLII